MTTFTSSKNELEPCYCLGQQAGETKCPCELRRNKDISKANSDWLELSETKIKVTNKG